MSDSGYTGGNNADRYAWLQASSGNPDLASVGAGQREPSFLQRLWSCRSPVRTRSSTLGAFGSGKGFIILRRRAQLTLFPL